MSLQVIKGKMDKKLNWLMRKSRTILSFLIDVLTGHCISKGHLSLVGVEEDLTCPKCDKKRSFTFWENVKHTKR